MSKRFLTILVVSIGLFLFSCSPGGISGTGTNAGNGKIVAMVMYPNGDFGKGVSVYIRSESYLRDTATVHMKRTPDRITNNKGELYIDSLDDGCYMLELHNECTFAKRVSFEILDGKVLDFEDTIILEMVSALKGSIDSEDVPDDIPVYVQIRGMEYVQRLHPDGQFLFRNLPPGEHKLNFLTGSEETGKVVDYSVKTASNSVTEVGEVSFPVSLARDTLYVRGLLDINGLTTTPVSEVITVAKGRVFALHLDSSGVSVFPKGLGRMRPRFIYLKGNGLTEFPIGISRIRSLVGIDLSDNNITSIPGFVAGMRILKSLKIANNSIEALDTTLTKVNSLEVLDLSNNEIATLPVSFGNLENLDSLYLNNNSLQDLPQSVTTITGLSYLNCNNNRLREVSDLIRDWIEENSVDSNWHDTQKR